MPIDRGVVQLGEDRVRAGGHAGDIVQAFDHVHLPQRTAQVQRAGIQPWELPDPAGQSVDAVRPIRDDIEERVRRLLSELNITTT